MQIWVAMPVVTLIFLGAFCAKANELTVVTYNIHHAEGTDGKLDIDRIAEIIKSLNPHVVCLQEVDRNLPRTKHSDMPALFSEKLGMTVIFEPNFQFDGGDYGNATLTSLPIVTQRNIALPNPISTEPRGCLVVTVEWQGKKIDVMNTHLGLNGQERLAQAEAIVKEFGENPVILAGDMNENSTAPGMQVIVKELKDTFIKKPESAKGTIPAGLPVRRIDFILVSSDFTVLSSSIIQNDITQVASDHLPYWVTLKF